MLGELTVDDEDGDRSYNFRMVIQVGSDPSIQPVPTLNAYLRRKFDNENIRVVTRPKKTDSLEVYIGEEFIGVLFVENEKGRRSYIFELPILDVDLVDADIQSRAFAHPPAAHASVALSSDATSPSTVDAAPRFSNRSASRAESAT